MALTRKPITPLLIVLSLVAVTAQATTLDMQREQFKEAYSRARGGDSTVLRDYQATLNDYALWPDLVSATFLGRLDRTADSVIASHLARYPDTSLNRTLRHRFARRLANNDTWPAYLDLYDTHYRQAGDTLLDCYAAQGRLATSNTAADLDAAVALWMVGVSQPDECDALFSALRARGILTPERHGERLRLALQANELKLARYLARSAPRAEVRWLERWEAMRKDPARELRGIGRAPRDELRDALYDFGIKQAARADAALAHRLLNETASSARIDAAQRRELELHIARRGARQGLREAATWLTMAPLNDPEVARWSVRSALRRGDWHAVLDTIDGMDDATAGETAWRYWRARALDELGRQDEASAVYAGVANERSYYGFLAADRLGQSYAFGHTMIASDTALAASLSQDPAIIRARELFHVGLYGPARSEWNAALSGRDAATRRQAALLADSWGWHFSSIRTLANSAGMDDLMRTFPTPWKAHFDEMTTAADITRTWAYGITRSESLFMTDARSSAGAIGLMQLIPGTGKETARRARLPYNGLETLLDPLANIQLGVTYLGRMYQRFDANQVLATAAYNAGARRVRGWLPDGSAMAADVWVESIPFNETRGYVQRVLYADTIFHWRLTGTERRLASVMPPIGAAPGRQVASK